MGSNIVWFPAFCSVPLKKETPTWTTRGWINDDRAVVSGLNALKAGCKYKLLFVVGWVKLRSDCQPKSDFVHIRMESDLNPHSISQLFISDLCVHTLFLVFTECALVSMVMPLRCYAYAKNNSNSNTVCNTDDVLPSRLRCSIIFRLVRQRQKRRKLCGFIPCCRLRLSGFCCVCHVFPPLVSIFGLFSCPCFMSLWVNLCPAVCMWLCVNYPVILVLSFEFAFVWSIRYSPVFLSMSVMPCLALPCLDLLKTVILSLRPRQRVPVSSSCLHRDTAIFLFFFFLSPLLSKHKEVRVLAVYCFFPLDLHFATTQACFCKDVQHVICKTSDVFMFYVAWKSNAKSDLTVQTEMDFQKCDLNRIPNHIRM